VVQARSRPQLPLQRSERVIRAAKQHHGECAPIVQPHLAAAVSPRLCVDVVEQFLRRHPEFSLESVDHRLDSAARGPGLQLSTGQHGSDGMYIAVLRRAPDGGVASESATSPTATVN